MYLSTEQARKYNRNRWVGIGSVILSILMIWAGIHFSQGLVIFAGVLGVIFSALWSVLTNRLAKFIEFKNKHFLLSGAHLDFLAHLEPSPWHAHSVIPGTQESAPKIKVNSSVAEAVQQPDS